MTIYCYDPQTGEHTGQMTAPKCPVTGVDVMPAWTTAIAPPAVEDNQVAKYVEAFLGDPAGRWVVTDLPAPEPAPEPTPEEVEAAVWTVLRAERNARLKDPALTDRLDRYRNQRDADLPTTDTAAWFQSALIYLQALRDLPKKTTDPTNPVWPEPPA